MYKRLQLLKIVGFSAASDSGFESCALLQFLHASCFKFDYLYVLSFMQVT